MPISIVNQEEIYNNLLELAKTERGKYDLNAIKEESEKILKSLSNLNPKIVKTNSVLSIMIDLTKTASYVVVLPPKYTLKAVDSMKILKELSEIINDNKYILFIFYSKKGRLTTAAYLYLGNIMEELNVGILFVNGDSQEINEVLDIIEKTGSYTPEEEKSVDINF
ncbi:MAG: hypothetical protein ACP5U0_06365 [Caldisphaera sp.]